MQKKNAKVREAVVELAKYIHETNPEINLIFEPSAADNIHTHLPFPVYTLPPPETSSPFPYTQATYARTPNAQHSLRHPHYREDDLPDWKIRKLQAGDARHRTLAHSYEAYHDKTDLLITLGGDGTILHAASLFSTSRTVPPFLSFSMGTLGFLGEARWKDYKTAFRTAIGREVLPDSEMGDIRILRRGRLKVGVFNKDGQRIGGNQWMGEGDVGLGDVHVMNEVNIHRGLAPHLAIVEVLIQGKKLTEAVADGIIISTPTGSTAYSLSSGGSIVHPAVSSILLTPICPRSLSFRPLVLPIDCTITLRLSQQNRSREVEVSVDGKRWGGMRVGDEMRVWGEMMECGVDGSAEGWLGGIPCIKVGEESDRDADGWVGGLNGLLKFNYPFGEED